MQKKSIKFELLAFYSQKQDRLCKKKSQTLIAQVKSTIIGGIIPDNLWPKILLAITHISNLLLIFSLDKLSPYKILTRFLSHLNYLKVLESMVYVFIHEIKKKAKSAK